MIRAQTARSGRLTLRSLRILPGLLADHYDLFISCSRFILGVACKQKMSHHQSIDFRHGIRYRLLFIRGTLGYDASPERECWSREPPVVP
jgi:hypothetical protein